MTRTERCVCGDYIRPAADDWDAIAGAVLLHNRTPRHVAYVMGWHYLEAETQPADWHYEGGRSIGTSVPFPACASVDVAASVTWKGPR